MYSFGASGAPLSQYLAWARDARTTWRAEALIVLVIGNDFDESLARYKVGPGFHHYVESGGGSLALRRFDYQPGLVRVLVEHSALARYLLLNVQAHHHVLNAIGMLGQILPSARAEPYMGNTAIDASSERIMHSQAAVRAFLRDMVQYAGWPPERVLFAVDGARYPAAMVQLPETYFGKMRLFFMHQARSAGFHVLDLDPAFASRYSASPCASNSRPTGTGMGWRTELPRTRSPRLSSSVAVLRRFKAPPIVSGLLAALLQNQRRH